jgi:HAMP domain-containing protein
MTADRAGAENDDLHQLIPYRLALMQTVLSWPFRQAAIGAVLVLCLWPAPAAAIDPFARHQVTVEFSTADGKTLADVEVRVFAPGRRGTPALTGRTDRNGRFEFSANEAGLWSAEARTADEIGRVTVRVGGAAHKQELEEPLSPIWVIAGLLLLLVLAFAFRVLRARSRRPRV